MAKKGKSLAEDVLARTANGRPGFRSWFDRLPPEVREELLDVRRQFNREVHQYRAYALAIIEAAEERGWQVAGEQQVIAWLKQKS